MPEIAVISLTQMNI